MTTNKTPLSERLDLLTQRVLVSIEAFIVQTTFALNILHAEVRGRSDTSSFSVGH